MKSSIRIAAVLMGGVLASLAATRANASVIMTVDGNSGTMESLTFSPFGDTDTPIANPYGALPLHPTSPTITSSGNTVTITFTGLGSAFTSMATNAGTGGETTNLDGKLDFDLQFSSPVTLSAAFSENGTDIVANTGTVGVNAGVVITETDDLNGFQQGGNFTPAFVSTNWTAGLTTTPFAQPYSNYHFSLDNGLIAEVLAAASLSTASITKNNLTITITTGSGAPEPASLGLLALGLAGLMVRRRRA